MIDSQLQLSNFAICNIIRTNLVPRVSLGGRGERSWELEVVFLRGDRTGQSLDSMWEKIEASKVIKK